MKKIHLFFLLNFAAFLQAEELVYTSPVVNESIGLVRTFVKSMLILAVIFALFVYWKKKLLPAMQLATMPGQRMKIVEKLFLDYTTVLYLVEIGDYYQVYGVSNKSLSLMNSFKKNELKLPVIKKTDLPPSFKDQLMVFYKKMEKKKRAKNS